MSLRVTSKKYAVNVTVNLIRSETMELLINIRRKGYRFGPVVRCYDPSKSILTDVDFEGDLLVRA